MKGTGAVLGPGTIAGQGWRKQGTSIDAETPRTYADFQGLMRGWQLAPIVELQRAMQAGGLASLCSPRLSAASTETPRTTSPAALCTCELITGATITNIRNILEARWAPTKPHELLAKARWA